MSNPAVALPSALAPLPAPRPAECWAEVRAHDRVMRYRRSGSGRALLVLCAADGAEPLWPELAGALATRFRLIVPDVPGGGDVAAWLAGFLEGLGAAGVLVVAAGGLCLPALELALLGPDQVARIVLVPAGEACAGEVGLDGALATGAAAVPLLVVRRGLAADDALPVVTRFLAGS